MARILVTGSADGLGRGAAVELLGAGHDVVVHARSPERARALDDLAGRGAAVLVGDLADTGETRALAAAANRLGPMDAVIHNAGVSSKAGPALPAVNVVAPVVWAVSTAWMLALEYADYPLGNRGMNLQTQRQLLRSGLGGPAVGQVSVNRIRLT